MLRSTIAFAVSTIAAVLLLCGPADAACSVRERASVPLTIVGGRILVPLTVNGIEAAFVLDTGAERSMVTPEAIRRLRLASDEWVATTMRGVGGVVTHPNADPRTLALGGLPLHRRTVTRDTSLTVGEMPGIASGGVAVDGLLGRDFLSSLDLELDVATRRLTVFDVRDCRGRFLPWTGDYGSVAAQMPVASAMVVPIMLDGRTLRALLDTGATSSLIVAPGMFRLGLTPALLARDAGSAAHGVGPQAPQMRRHRFASLRIGSQVERDPLLWVAPVRVVPIVDALLGADWVTAQRRVWISFATAQVFFQK